MTTVTNHQNGQNAASDPEAKDTSNKSSSNVTEGLSSSSSSTTTTTRPSISDPNTVTFVDYRRPPSVKVQPPSKYKLWLIVFVLVYFAVWVAEAAKLNQALRFHGWLSPDGTQFFELAITVFVLVFGALDFFVAICTITIKGKEYGLGPWMKCGSRIQWIHQTQFSDYFLMECLKGTIHILEEGFGMFNSTTAPAPTKRIQPKPRSSSIKHSHKTNDGDKNVDDKEGDYSYHSDSDVEDNNHRAPYTCTSDNCKTLVKIEHRINPDKMAEYDQWQKRIQRAAEFAPGLISIQRMDIVEEELESENEDVEDNKMTEQQQQQQQEEEDIEVGLKQSNLDNTTTSNTSIARSIVKRLPTFRHSPTTGYSTNTTTTNLHTVYLTFENIDSLNDWMMSPRRKALMNQLEPLLAVPDQELIQAERAAYARDAFTNLTIQQGQSSPTLPPKKWKVWWLTTVALVITIRWSTSFMEYYLEFWGLNESHPRLRMLVIIFIVTFLNSYVMVPFSLFLFHPWLIRQSNEVDERFIWKTLNDGIQSMWLKFLLTFAFYGGCIIAWIVQKYAM